MANTSTIFQETDSSMNDLFSLPIATESCRDLLEKATNEPSSNDGQRYLKVALWFALRLNNTSEKYGILQKIAADYIKLQFNQEVAMTFIQPELLDCLNEHSAIESCFKLFELSFTAMQSQSKPELSAESYEAISILSKREMSCFTMLIKAYTIEDISKELGLAIPTIANYISRIKHKLKCDSRTDMVALAQSLGLAVFHI
jgi:DNA-binding CsgD family transcriptional regulator